MTRASNRTGIVSERTNFTAAQTHTDATVYNTTDLTKKQKHEHKETQKSTQNQPSRAVARRRDTRPDDGLNGCAQDQIEILPQ